MRVKNATLFLLLGIIAAFQCNAKISKEEKEAITTGIESGKEIAEGLSNFKPVTSGLANSERLQRFTKGLGKRLINNLGNIAGFLGAAGGLVSLIMIFLPEQDSAELKYMKEQFGIVNHKLDKVVAKIDNLENIIKLESQKAAYLSASNKILHAQRQLLRFMDETFKLKCSPPNCKRKRMSIAKRYIKDLNVKLYMESVLHASYKPVPAFGDKPLLELVSDRYKCQVTEIDKFADGILYLALKGQESVFAHEIMTGSNHSISQSMADWLKNVNNLRNKVNQVKSKCFKNFQSQVIKEIKKTEYQSGSASNKEANQKVIKKLNQHYPWISTVAFSYKQYGGSKHAIISKYGFLSMPASQKDRKRNLLVGIEDLNGKYKKPKDEVTKALGSFKYGYRSISKKRLCDKLVRDIYKKVRKYVQTVAVRKVDHSDKFDYQGAKSAWVAKKLKVYRGYRHYYYFNVVVLLESEERSNGVVCSRKCKNGGQCKIYPFSSIQYCVCKGSYVGSTCETNMNGKLAKTIDMMLKNTLPLLRNVNFDIGDLRRFVGTSIGNLQKGISQLESSMQRKLHQLLNEMKNHFKWTNLITMYKDAIQTIEYFAYRFERLTKDTTNKEAIQRNGRELALAALQAKGGIREALFQLHTLLVGKVDKPLFDHKPLLVELMPKAGNTCTQSYNNAMTNYKNQFEIFQLLGYTVWARALTFAGKQNSISSQYQKRRLAEQEKVLKKSTCKLYIKNSVNALCKEPFMLPEDVVGSSAYEEGPLEDEDVEQPPQDVELSTEDVKLFTEDVDLFTEDVELPTEDVKLFTEDVELPTEDVKLLTEDVELFTEDVELFTEDVELPTEDVKLFTEDVELFTEDVKLFTEDVKLLTEDVELFTEDVGLFTEDVELPTEDVKLLTEDVKLLTEDVELFTEDVELFTEDVDLFTEDVELPTEDVKLFTEDVELFTEDVELFTEDVDLFTEDVELPTEDVKLFTEDVELFTEDVDLSTEDVELSTEGVELSTEGVDLFTEDVELSTEDVKLFTEDAELSTEGVDLFTEDVELSTEDVKLSTEDVKLSTEDVDLSTEGVDLFTEDAELSTEDVDLSTEDVELSTEDVDLSTEGVDLFTEGAGEDEG
eukprot:gene17345-19077_t